MEILNLSSGFRQPYTQRRCLHKILVGKPEKRDDWKTENGTNWDRNKTRREAAH